MVIKKLNVVKLS